MHLHTCDILWSTVVIILSDVHIVHLWLVGTSSSLFQSIGWIKTSYHNIIFWGSVQFSRSVVSDSLRPHELQPGLSVHHQLPEFTQTHTHRVSDAIQPSHPLSSPSPPAPNPSQHQGLFQWVNSSHEVAKVLQFQPQHQPIIYVYIRSYIYIYIHTYIHIYVYIYICIPRDQTQYSYIGSKFLPTVPPGKHWTK